MTLITPFIVVTKKTLIVSKMVYQIHTKMLEKNVQYRVAVKTSYYFIDLLLVFQNYLIFGKDSNYAFNSVYEKSIDFLKINVLNSQ